MVGLFGKCQLFTFYMAWIYLIFHGIMLQCMLFMMAVEYFMDASFSLVFGNFGKLKHDVSSSLSTWYALHLFWLLCNFSWKWHCLHVLS